MRLLKNMFNLAYVPVPCVHVCLYRGGGLGVGWGVFKLYAIKLTVIVVFKIEYFWCVICVFCEKIV